MDFIKVIKTILKILLKLHPEDRKSLFGMLGSFAGLFVLLMVGSVIMLAISAVVAIPLSSIYPDIDLAAVSTFLTFALLLVLFVLHIYRAYKNGFYEK
jgi:hypothetical protein